jgi:hypothetical protein
MRNLVKVEAKGKNRSKWKEVISAYPNGKWADFMYVCATIIIVEIRFS